MTASPSLIADLLERLDPERRYEFEERAGIIEFDGQLPRDQAEALALIDLLRSYPGALVGVTALEVDRAGAREFVATTDVDLASEQLGCVVRVVDLAELVCGQFAGLARLTTFDARF